MPALSKDAIYSWPEDWNEPGTLFAAAAEFGPSARTLFMPAEPEGSPEPPEAELLPGVKSNQLGYWAELAVDAKIAELGGHSEKAMKDDEPYDRLIYLGAGKPKTAQVKYAGIKNDKAQFNLGPRVGHRDSQGDKRRRLSSRSRADVYILVTYWRRTPRFYIIPARRLRDRVSVTITPGRRRLRRQTWKHMEPEDYVDSWHYCAENMTEHELTLIHDCPVGQLEMATTAPWGS
jgi:hypothetical protein